MCTDGKNICTSAKVLIAEQTNNFHMKRGVWYLELLHKTFFREYKQIFFPNCNFLVLSFKKVINKSIVLYWDTKNLLWKFNIRVTAAKCWNNLDENTKLKIQNTLSKYKILFQNTKYFQNTSNRKFHEFISLIVTTELEARLALIFCFGS